MNQQKDPLDNKTSFNVGFTLMLMHSLGILIFCRNKYGLRVLGRPCVGAFVVMVMWASFSRDSFMYAWVAGWCVLYVKRRAEAQKLQQSGEIPSHSDGYPQDAMRYCKSVKTARTIVEPVLVGILGAVLFVGYQHMGWPIYGLPYYVLFGCLSLPFVEGVKRTVWDRRVQSMVDARMEGEELEREFRDRFDD